MELTIKKYSEDMNERWDDFVLKSSLNGLFLQTRNFLNYHSIEKFDDSSIMIYKGNELISVIPGCTIKENDKNIFISHLGSTFGGIILNSKFYDVKHVEAILQLLDDYFSQIYQKVILKNTSDILIKTRMPLLDYMFYNKGFKQFQELSSYIDLFHYNPDVLSNFSSSKRRDYKYSLKFNLDFRGLIEDEDIEEFCDIQKENLKKFNRVPIHSVKELLDFKNAKLKDSCKFFGVFLDNKLIAGSMVFLYNGYAFHTQYLVSRAEEQRSFCMDFLIVNLIDLAISEGYRIFSFGISTEDNGKYLNSGLVKFKEGFGAKYDINKIIYKEY